MQQAHTHARNAVLETRKSNPVAASEEHDLAAGEFATVAQNSRDREVSLPVSVLASLGLRVNQPHLCTGFTNAPSARTTPQETRSYPSLPT